MLQCSGTTLRVRLRHPLVFLVVPTYRENLFPITSLLDLLSFLLFWIIIPVILPTTMLRYYSLSASSMPSEIFHRRFDLLEVHVDGVFWYTKHVHYTLVWF
jgi:hypothetical protein